MREVAIVRDADGNEMFFGEPIGECKEYCTENNITSINGEYIAIGMFNEDNGYFQVEDYETI